MLGSTFRKLFEDATQAPLSEHYLAAGTICQVLTNSALILAAARGSFAPVQEQLVSADISMHLWVDPAARSSPPWPEPYFRGLSNMVFTAFDHENEVLIDLRGGRAIGRFSQGMAADRDCWKRVIFPTLFGIFSETIGITALHCACVERGGRALLLAGGSGSGKSTLSLALAQNGFAFLSDDWTYFSRRDGRLLAWGLPTPLKLLPPALEHFPQLQYMKPGTSLNGELAYEVEPQEVFGVRRSLCAEPQWLMFLERQGTLGVSLAQMSPVDAAARFEEDLEHLPPTVSGGRDFLVKTIRILAQRSCWVLRYGEGPQSVARAVSDFVEGRSGSALSPTDWSVKAD